MIVDFYFDLFYQDFCIDKLDFKAMIFVSF